MDGVRLVVVVSDGLVWIVSDMLVWMVSGWYGWCQVRMDSVRHVSGWCHVSVGGVRLERIVSDMLMDDVMLVWVVSGQSG